MSKQRHSHRRARLGQHFLIDAQIRDLLISNLNLDATDVWVEIGAGRGYLTEALAGRVRKLFAVELDPRWALTLKAGFINSKTVTVVCADILRLDFHDFLDGTNGGRTLRVVGNLPYYITSPILFHLFNYADLLREAFLMVQQEVAERVTAAPSSRDYGYASLATQFFAKAEILFSIPPRAFSPPPKVRSAVIHLVFSDQNRSQLQIDDTSEFLKFGRGIFSEKRKTLLNNLRRMIPVGPLSARLAVEELLLNCGLHPQVRAENLSLADAAHLYRTLRLRGLL